MPTIKKPRKSNAVHLKPNSYSTPQENVADLAKVFHDVCETAHATTYGVSAWFKAYLKSKDWTSLDDDTKDQAFECYTNLCYVLKELSKDGALLQKEEDLHFESMRKSA